MRTSITVIALLLVSLLSFGSHAQPDDAVYVTTQDFVSLRELPSRQSERLAIIPPEVTLRAYGRTGRTDWIQVEYEGQFGWVASWLLIWSGPLIELPIDGVETSEEFIRRSVAFGETFRESPIYLEGLDPSTQVGTIPSGEQFEITGFVGTGELFWVQVNYQGRLVWMGSWDVLLLDGRIDNTLNGAYRYVYGRINGQLTRDITNAITSLVAIESIWLRIRNGETVFCSPIPPFAIRGTEDRDIEREPIFRPVVIALDDALIDVNGAISRFEDICTTDPVVTIEDVDQALDDLERARRNITLAQALMNELSNRDPVVN